MLKKILLILLVIALVACSTTKPNQGDENPIDNIPQPDDVVLYRSLFNGEPLNEQPDKYQAFGIMISNSKEARPQSGLATADIVYEIAVESYSITRFLAIFASNFPNKIGPARSARIPFVRLIQEWDLPYAHYGAAKKGLGDAKTLIEQIKPPMRFDGVHGINHKYYFRSTDRKAPHNAYFNSEAAFEILPELEYKQHFVFDDSSNINQTPVLTLLLHYSSYTPVKYQYDSLQNKYLRFLHDSPMLDANTHQQIAVTNIIVQHAPHSTVEKVRYVLVDFVGEGKAEYYINGYYEEGIWKKQSHDSVTQFLNNQGEPIILLPGNTWIQVVHPKVKITRE